jgi:uncharacterized protein YifN (PemK superfamily)
MVFLPTSPHRPQPGALQNHVQHVGTPITDQTCYHNKQQWTVATSSYLYLTPLSITPLTPHRHQPDALQNHAQHVGTPSTDQTCYHNRQQWTVASLLTTLSITPLTYADPSQAACQIAWSKLAPPNASTIVGRSSKYGG